MTPADAVRTVTTAVGRSLRYGLVAAVGELRAVGQSVTRVRTAGPEREQLVQAVKSAGAALLSWCVAAYLLDSPVALMAPWVAVVMMEATVYRTITKAVKQLGAIAVGAGLALGTAALIGDTLVELAVVLPVTLLLAQWRRLGEQGVYGATTALFVLAYGSVTWVGVLDRFVECVLGAVVGVAVNTFVHPPTMLRNSRTWVTVLARDLDELLDRMARGLAGTLTYDRARGWHAEVYDLDDRLTDLRSTMSWSRESLYLNPRRPRRQLTRHELGYEQVASVFEQTVAHVADLTRTFVDDAKVTQAIVDGADRSTAASTLLPFAAFLRQLAGGVRVYADGVTANRPPPDAAELLGERRRRAESALRRFDAEVRRTFGQRDEPILGSLLLIGNRLLEDIQEMESSAAAAT